MDLLLQMIEWHRFLEEWAPPLVVERLRATFPHYDPDEIWRARLEALDLFRWLAQETGARLGYSYPTELESTIMTWVRDQAPEPEGGRS